MQQHIPVARHFPESQVTRCLEYSSEGSLSRTWTKKRVCAGSLLPALIGSQIFLRQTTQDRTRRRKFFGASRKFLEQDRQRENREQAERRRVLAGEDSFLQVCAELPVHRWMEFGVQNLPGGAQRRYCLRLDRDDAYGVRA